MITSKELSRRYIESLVTAFTLVIGLSWNTAFENYFNKQEKLKKMKYGRWIYASVLTIVLIIVIFFLNRLLEKL